MALGDNKGSNRPNKKGFENSKPLPPKLFKFENSNLPKPPKAEPKEVVSNHANMGNGDNRFTPKKVESEISNFDFEQPKAEHKKTTFEFSKVDFEPTK